MTEKTTVFDYGAINEDHKAAAEQIVELCKELQQPLVAEYIKHKFKLVEPNRFDIEKSSFVKACTDAGIYVAIQGWISEGVGPEEVQYQICCINEDIRKLDNLIDSLKNK